MEFQDTNIQCVTCGREFIYTAREQDFFSRKGFKEPRHCRECRQRRKRERENSFSGASGQDHPTSREMFSIVCANCERETTVPFKPTTGKPVLCKDCFIATRYGAPAQTKPTTPEAKDGPAPEEKGEEEQATAPPLDQPIEDAADEAVTEAAVSNDEPESSGGADESTEEQAAEDGVDESVTPIPEGSETVPNENATAEENGEIDKDNPLPEP